MKLNLTEKQIYVRLAYHNYSQKCLNNDPIEIPYAYKDWIKKVDEKEIKQFLEKYIRKD